MNIRILLVTASLATFVALSGCTDGKSGNTVSATDNQFTPNTMTVKEDTAVSFKNDGNVLHSVTVHKVGDPATQTKKDTDIAKDASTTYEFPDAGTYHVYCKYHSGGAAGNFGTGMVMTVTVNEG